MFTSEEAEDLRDKWGQAFAHTTWRKTTDHSKGDEFLYCVNSKGEIIAELKRKKGKYIIEYGETIFGKGYEVRSRTFIDDQQTAIELAAHNVGKFYLRLPVDVAIERLQHTKERPQTFILTGDRYEGKRMRLIVNA
jgi:hypothetical protein